MKEGAPQKFRLEHPRWSRDIVVTSRSGTCEIDGVSVQFEHIKNAFLLFKSDGLVEKFFDMGGFYIFAEDEIDFQYSSKEKFEYQRYTFEPWRKRPPKFWWQHRVFLKEVSEFSHVNVASDAFISPHAQIFTDSIVVGSGSWVASSANLRHYVTIGQRSGVNAFTTLAGKVDIGSDTHIASGTRIFGVNHGHQDTRSTIISQASTMSGVRIGADVWIGANVSILDGVDIGSHSIVGAGAVISRSFPEYSVIVGNPARMIRDRRG